MGSPRSDRESDSPAYFTRPLPAAEMQRARELLGLTKSNLASIKDEVGKGTDIDPSVIAKMERSIRELEDRHGNGPDDLSEKPS